MAIFSCLLSRSNRLIRLCLPSLSRIGRACISKTYMDIGFLLMGLLVHTMLSSILALHFIRKLLAM
uniref:Uncharacterized protein n=1 Tax=Arundo donax TaxID=35708 RepID=A0A0A8YTF9_ARUDO